MRRLRLRPDLHSPEHQRTRLSGVRNRFSSEEMRIRVEHVFPPIPIRVFDWAVYDEDSICCDECPYTVGRGETKEAAWLDFAEQIAEEIMCEGCDDFPALSNSNFCAECQKEIKADSRHEDPARSHGRPQ